MDSEEDIPSIYLCPILQTLMEDPVITEDGQTYERLAIEKWFATNTNKSPLTGLPLASKRLTTNYALKSLIEDYKKSHPDQSSADTVQEQPSPPSAVIPQVDMFIARHNDDDQSLASATMVLVGDVPDCPVHLVVVLDVSASMSSTSPSARQSFAAEGVSSFSRLDLVKHSMNTAIEMLRSTDYLTIIKFSHEAQCVMPVCRMDSIGKMIAKAKVEALYTETTTNLWGGLWTGIQEILKPMDQAFMDNGGHGAILLMTDGYPSSDFLLPSDIVRVLKTKLSRLITPYSFSIHCCGYGQGDELDSAVLQQISSLGRGLFTYISDGTMVGTVFVNLVSNLMSAALVDTQLVVSDPVTGQAETERHVTFLRPDQPKTLYFERGRVKGKAFSLTTRRGTVRIEPRTVSLRPNDPSPYLVFVSGLERLFMELEGGHQSLKASATLESVHQQLQAIAATQNQNKHAQLYLEDWIYPTNVSKGQVARAARYETDWRRWGCHYLRATLSAHQHQETTNFKDGSLLAYATPRLLELYATGYATFADLKPPRSSCRAAPQVVSMQALVNPAAGCFTGEAKVTMEDGHAMSIGELRRGMKVKGGFAVDYLVLFHQTQGTELCYPVSKDGGFGVSPYHPFLHQTGDGGDKDWAFPVDHYPAKFQSNVPVLFNLVLTTGHVVEIQGLEFVTLGHGFSANAVVAHPYFGTQRVVDDVKRVDVEESGVAVFRRPVFIRDSTTEDGMVIGIVDL